MPAEPLPVPDDPFFWGVATSAFQMEGSRRADWHQWDYRLRMQPEASGHYRSYRQDVGLLGDLGVNAYRFSLEWSRLQPTERTWDRSAVRHYRDLVTSLLQRGIEPMLTVHHFTHPQWFAANYGWHHEKSVPLYLRYLEEMIELLPEVRYWVTFNEPNVFLLGGYLDGCTPPGLSDPVLFRRAAANLLRAHSEAYRLIHDQIPRARVSIAHNMTTFAPWSRFNPLDRLICRTVNQAYNRSFLDAFLTGRLEIPLPLSPRPLRVDAPVRGCLDFLGINYYMRLHLRFNPMRLGKHCLDFQARDAHQRGLTDMGWEIYPVGLLEALAEGSRLGIPMIVTENGIATNDEIQRIEYLRSHVEALHRARGQGYNVRGYFYWSLLDNYEWHHGFQRRFGLYRVDFKNLRRHPTPAAACYASLIGSNRG